MTHREIYGNMIFMSLLGSTILSTIAGITWLMLGAGVLVKELLLGSFCLVTHSTSIAWSLGETPFEEEEVRLVTARGFKISLVFLAAMILILIL